MIDKEFAIMFGIIAIIFAIVICILLKKGVKKTALVCIFIAYITAVVCIVFFPILYDEPVVYGNGYTWYNLVPFATIAETVSGGFGETAFLQIFGNILLSVPFGFFVMMWMKKPKLWKMFVLHSHLQLQLSFLKCLSVLQSTTCTAMLILMM